MVRYLWQENDIHNFQKKRNLNNSNKRYYNCAGYALETFNWYAPSEHYRELDLTDLDDCVDFMIKDFNGYLRRINDISELKEDEYAIAFRMSNDNDFHYIKRDKRGIWRHKRGGMPFIETIKQKYVFSDLWFSYYEGEIALLAKKRI